MWKPTQTQVPGIRTWTSLGDHYSAGFHLIFFSYLSAHLQISYSALARLWLGLANYSPWAESAHWLFVNNILSEHGHAHPYILMWLSAFAAQQQSWAVMADPVWPEKPNKVCCPALYRKNLPASEYTGGEHLLTGPCKHRSVSELAVPSLQPVPKPTSPASL